MGKERKKRKKEEDDKEEKKEEKKDDEEDTINDEANKRTDRNSKDRGTQKLFKSFYFLILGVVTALCRCLANGTIPVG